MESTRRGRSSVRARAALALTVALCATSLVGEASTGVTGAITTPAAQQLGFYPGYANLIQFKALETWVGRDANYVLQFADQTATKFPGSVWGQVTKAGALQTIANRVTLVESIPLAFGNNIDASTAAGQAYARTALQATANGANDANYRIAAKYIRDGGYADSIIRLGWEFDGGWYPWSARGNEALWVTAYRHVVGVFRTISPTFRFDWNGDPGAIQKETAAYPGDAYVDIIGLDVYDKGIPVPWSSATKSWVDPVAALNWDLTSLRFQRDFATAHGKQVSYPEWALSGVTTTVTSGVGGDNPTFVQGMNDFMNALPSSGPGSLAYQAYFNEDAGDGNHRINATYFPTAQQRYRSAFGSTTDFIVSSNNSAPVFGQPLALSATLHNDNLPVSAFTGTVRFFAGTKALGPSVGVANGVANSTTSIVPAGDNSITARYTPAAGVVPFMSTPFAQHVDRISTTLSVTAGVTNPVYSQTFNVVATPSPVAPGTKIPTGSVTFTNRSTNVTNTRLLVYGKAILSTSSLALGVNTFSVQYNGGTNFAPATATLNRTVVGASSATTLTWAPHVVAAGAPVAFAALVKCVAPCVVVPTGTVTFSDGATAISSAIPLDAAGGASFTTSSLARGTHSIKATYSGSGGISPSARSVTATIS